jgi:N-(2-amino-2-carboxyethyl)-L-glutamate synthase
MIKSSILDAIGNTPLVKLNKLFENRHFQCLAKIETINPGGSIKDRPAFNMIINALNNGEINSKTTVVESSSGNMAIGLAQVCNYLNMRLICVIDSKTTKHHINILRAFGTELEIITERDPSTQEFLPMRLRRVKYLLDTIPNSFWCNQYANLNNSNAHHQTMSEILADMNGQIPDYLYCAVSTCGTLRGCSEYIRQNKLKTKIIAVDALGSLIFSKKKWLRHVPGHGAAILPELFSPDLNDDYIIVTDMDCVNGCRRLLKYESILAGGSSGGVITAVDYHSEHIPKDAICVAIICDSGERYLDTIYCDDWVRENIGKFSSDS